MLKWKALWCSLIGLLTVAAATVAAGAASINSFGQPKEPANLKKMLKK